MPFWVSTCTEEPGTRLSANRAILVLDVIQESLPLVFTASVVDFFSSAAFTHAGDAASARPTTTLALSLIIRCIAFPPLFGLCSSRIRALHAAGQGEDQKREQDDSQQPAREVTPAPAVRPCRESSQHHQNEHDDENRAEHLSPLLSAALVADSCHRHPRRVQPPCRVACGANADAFELAAGPDPARERNDPVGSTRATRASGASPEESRPGGMDRS